MFTSPVTAAESVVRVLLRCRVALPVGASPRKQARPSATRDDTSDLLAQLKRETSIRPFLETLYAPSAAILAPSDNTTICRCEEITAGQIREALDLGTPGPNQVKSLLRSGMGPCQGRMCGLAVTEIIAQHRGEAPSVVNYYRIRPPLKPLALSELASLGSFASEPATTE